MGHGFSIDGPVAAAPPTGLARAKKPWFWLITPRPRHSGHVRERCPGAAPLPPHVPHCTILGTLILVVTPFNESSKESLTATVMSSPRSARCGLPPPPPAAAAEPPPPPNRLPKRSAKSPPMGCPPW